MSSTLTVRLKAMISLIKNLFNRPEPKERRWLIWNTDLNERYTITTTYSHDPRSEWGGPIRWDTETYKFIPLDIVDTLERLDMGVKWTN